jgi:hypothetical protein
VLIIALAITSSGTGIRLRGIFHRKLLKENV